MGGFSPWAIHSADVVNRESIILPPTPLLARRVYLSRQSRPAFVEEKKGAGGEKKRKEEKNKQTKKQTTTSLTGKAH